MRYYPKGYGGERVQPDDMKRQGWKEQGILVVDISDGRLTWPERELLKQLGTKLYGTMPREEAHV
jgi:hypothetical protein